MPHIVAPMEELMSMHTPWDVMAEHCKLFVSFGGVRTRTARSTRRRPKHHVKGGLYGMRAKGVRFVNVTPTADDLDTGGAVEWLAIRPNTDTALILALCHTLMAEKPARSRLLARYTMGFDKFAPSLAGKDAAGPRRSPASPLRASRRWRARWRRHAPRSASTGRCSAAINGEQPFWHWSRSPACWARSACRAAASRWAMGQST